MEDLLFFLSIFNGVQWTWSSGQRPDSKPSEPNLIALDWTELSPGPGSGFDWFLIKAKPRTSTRVLDYFYFLFFWTLNSRSSVWELWLWISPVWIRLTLSWQIWILFLNTGLHSLTLVCPQFSSSDWDSAQSASCCLLIQLPPIVLLVELRPSQPSYTETPLFQMWLNISDFSSPGLKDLTFIRLCFCMMDLDLVFRAHFLEYLVTWRRQRLSRPGFVLHVRDSLAPFFVILINLPQVRCCPDFDWITVGKWRLWGLKTSERTLHVLVLLNPGSITSNVGLHSCTAAPHVLFSCV